jgi:DNA helicase II / ATP-dependent DNA helicase PcrA
MSENYKYEKEMRIFGIPGSGKTFRLKAMVEHLIKQGTEPDFIAITSFSKAAAREVASRIQLPEDRIGTLHSFAFKAMEIKKDQVAESHLADWNTQSRFQLTGSTSNLDDGIGDNEKKTNGDELFSQYQVARARMTPREQWDNQVQIFANDWEAWKAQHQYWDFTDMIEWCDPEKLPIIEHLFVDEVQDMSALELDLIRKWGALTERYVLAGDPNQAIYGFKGADGSGFLNPKLPDEQVIVLSQSYRVPETIWSESSKWQLEPLEYWPRDEAGITKRVPLMTMDAWRAQFILNEYPGTIMFLTTAGYMLNKLIAWFREKHIPFHNPYRLKDGRWNPINHNRMNLCHAAQKGTWTHAELWRMTEHLKPEYFARKGAKGQLETAKKDDPNTHANLEQYMNKNVIDALASKNFSEIASLYVGNTKAAGLAYTFKAIHAHGIQACEKPRIIVGTCHSVKGGEADTVVLFPDLSPVAWLGMKPGSPEQASIHRTIYVGMTRAKQNLLLAASCTPHAINWNAAPREPLTSVTL